MEQGQIKFIHISLGIFVIGALLMTLSLEKQIIEDSKIISSISIYLISFSILLFGITYYYKLELIDDLSKKKGLRNSKELFIVTNTFWFLLFFTFYIDEFIRIGDTSFIGFDIILIFLLFGMIVVNFILVVFSFYTNFEVPIFYTKRNLLFTDYIAILTVSTFILFFSFIIYFLITIRLPVTAICFTVFNLILINVLSAIIKNNSTTI